MLSPGPEATGMAPPQQPLSPGETEWKVNAGPVGLLQRAAATLWVARKVSQRVKNLDRELAEDMEMDAEEKRERRDQMHRENGQMAVQHILKYKGFLAKVGQGLSASGGGIPAPIREELSVLQDHMPVSSFAEVRSTIQSQLHHPLDEIFKEFSERPVASATVGQAHMAVLRTGQKVCVKVQHKGVARIMATDLASVEYLAKRALKVHRDAPDITPVIAEWKRASREEVDFRLEAGNAERAAAACERHGLEVKCPKPIREHCTRSVLTMEFIEGWKITDVARLPPGTDRAALARQVLEAFALLTFDEGLIHGDLHPGNVFVEPVESSSLPDSANKAGVRPVLLDWGIVKALSLEERTAVARLLTAVLARDSIAFVAALQDLGFGLSANFEKKEMRDWMNGLFFLHRDSIPTSAKDYLFRQFGELGEKAEERKKEEAAEKNRQNAKGVVKLQAGWMHWLRRRKKKQPADKAVATIPGVIVFYGRAINLLQGMCSALDVTVSFTEPILRHALPLLEAACPSLPPACTPPASAAASQLESAVRAALEAARSKGLLGAQVAVRQPSAQAGDADTWLCNLAIGRAGRADHAAGPINERTLMPLLGAGVGVLVACLLSTLQKPTAIGEVMDLSTPVSDVWPEFKQRGKAGVSIADLLQHRSGLTNPYPCKLSLKGFCSEKTVEEAVAASPRGDDQGRPCQVLGVAAAALLKRATGQQHAAGAMRAVLLPLGLSEDITYSVEDHARMAYIGREPMKGLSLTGLFEFVEKRAQDLGSRRGGEAQEWLTAEELAEKLPESSDPHLANRPDVRRGEACLPGQGLRATAQALCRLYAACDAGFLAPKVLQASMEQQRLRVPSTRHWEAHGRCLDAGLGWQLFKFQRMDGAGDVVGYGHADGSTGSIALCVPGYATIAVLINGMQAVGEDAPHLGHEFLTLITKHLGLEPIWHLEVPQVPKDTPMAPGQAGKAEDDPLDMHLKLSRLEERLEQVTAMLERLMPGAELAAEQASPAENFGGVWASSSIEGLETVLEALEVPAILQGMAKRTQRSLRIKVRGDEVSLASTTTLAGKTLDESCDFTIGSPFKGKQLMGGTYQGLAKWCDAGIQRALVLDKSLVVKGRNLLMEERFELRSEDLLAVTLTCRGLQGELGTTDIKCTMVFDRQGGNTSQRKGISASPTADKKSTRTMQDDDGRAMSGVLCLCPLPFVGTCMMTRSS